MKRRTVRGWIGGMLVLILGAMGLSACDDGGGSSDLRVLSGTAATGAAFSGMVEAVNAVGERSGLATINANGSFSLSLSNRPPFLLRAVGSDGVTQMFSYAAAPGTVNITPLSNLAVLMANRGLALSALFEAWGRSTVTPAEVQASARSPAQQLRTQFAARGLNADQYDFFTTAFQVGQAGFDRLLDAIRVVYGPGSAARITDAAGSQLASGSFSVNGTATATTGGTHSGATTNSPAATSSTASLTASNATPSSGNGAITASRITAESAGGTLSDWTRVKVTGKVGGVDAEVQVYFVTATGVVKNISYNWGSLTMPTQGAFCSDTCSGASVDLTAKKVTLSNVALDQSSFNGAATLNGTINFGAGSANASGTQTGAIAGGWRLTVTGTALNAPVNQTINLTAAEVPPDQATYATTAQTFAGNIAASVSTPDAQLQISFANVTTTYAGNVRGAVGDTIDATFKGNISVTGSVTTGGITVPVNVSGPADLVYKYERIS